MRRRACPWWCSGRLEKVGWPKRCFGIQTSSFRDILIRVASALHSQSSAEGHLSTAPPQRICPALLCWFAPAVFILTGGRVGSVCSSVRLLAFIAARSTRSIKCRRPHSMSCALENAFTDLCESDVAIEDGVWIARLLVHRKTCARGARTLAWTVEASVRSTEAGAKVKPVRERGQ